MIYGHFVAQHLCGLETITISIAGCEDLFCLKLGVFYGRKKTGADECLRLYLARKRAFSSNKSGIKWNVQFVADKLKDYRRHGENCYVELDLTLLVLRLSIKQVMDQK